PLSQIRPCHDPARRGAAAFPFRSPSLRHLTLIEPIGSSENAAILVVCAYTSSPFYTSSPMSAPAQFVSLARKTALADSLDPALVCAVVEQESSWNPWAMRYEPLFFTKY